MYSVNKNTNKSTMDNTITANELKTKGISIADKMAMQGLETIVTIRGEAKYIILPKEQYYALKEHELMSALAESEEDLKKGKYKKGSVKDHIKRITNA
jgi:hypothetical protein